MTEVVQMDSKTWRIEDGFVRYFLLCGEEKAVLLDTGATAPDGLSIAEKYTDLAILLFNTHGDGDHVAGTAAFSKIHMGAEDYENCGVKARFPQTALVPVSDGQIIDLGGRTLQIITIPGHTYGSIAVLDKERRTLYAGDSVQDGSVFMFGKHRCPDAFEASLKKLIAMADAYDQIVACHGTPVLPADYVGKVLACWKKVLAGESVPKDMELHGTMVKSYEMGDCGFYC